MGASQSNESQPLGMFQHAMNHINITDKQANGGNIIVGGESEAIDLNELNLESENIFYGGKLSNDAEIIRQLKNYRESKSSKAKEAVLKSIIDTLKSLGIISGDQDMDDVVKTIKDKLPNPRKGKTFSSDAHEQAEICKKIAIAINKGIKGVYGDGVKDIIDVNGPPEYVCSTVVDIIHSFSSGLHLEFLTVYKAVTKILKELAEAKEVLKNSADVLINMEPDDEQQINRERFLEIYKKAERELELKLQMLNGYLNANLLPSSEELKMALESEKGGREFVETYSIPGTEEFGDSIAFVISNMGAVAGVTNMLNKTLKEIGMSMTEYMKLSSVKELDKYLDEKLDNAIKITNSEKKKIAINNILLAVDRLKKYFGKRKKIAEMKTGGAPTYVTSSEIREKDLDKRIKRSEKAQELFEDAFAKELYSHYNQLLATVDKIGPKIGKEIKLDHSLDQLVQAFFRLAARDLKSEFIDQALVGIKYDYRSQEIKKSFINSLHQILSAIKEVNQSNSLFDDLKKHVNAILDTIDRFTKLATAKLGGSTEVTGGADNVDVDIEALAAELNVEIDAEGGALFEKTKFGLNKYSQSAFKIDDAVGKMVYYYYIANINNNIKRGAEEYKEYSKNYKKILSHAMRFKREDLIRRKQKIFKLIDHIPSPSQNAAGAWTYLPTIPVNNDPDINITAPIANAGTYQIPAYPANLNNNPALVAPYDQDHSPTKDEKEKIKEYLNESFKARDQLYQVVESVELYLKNYTGKIIENPNVVKELKKALDSSNVITKWFSDETGNSLFRAFQSTTINTPGKLKRYNSAIRALKQSDAAIPAGGVKYYTNNHPYNLLWANRAANGPAADYYTLMNAPAAGGEEQFTDAPSMIGHVGQNVQQFNMGTIDKSDVNDHISDAIDNFQALQNIINAFVTIIPLDNKDDTLLSPRTMYKYLIHYLKMSSLSESYEPIANGGILYNFDINFTNIYNHVNNLNEQNDDYKYFVMLMKAIVSKILVTLGLYQLHEAPASLDEISPIRYILGGTNDQPKVIKEAVELYYRVPRMIEYYRSKLDFTQSQARYNAAVAAAALPQRTSFIATVIDPEMKFYKLFNLMWDELDQQTVTGGTYSDDDCYKIIECINEIYNQYKSDPDYIKKILYDINYEFNRRFGIITASENRKLGEIKRWRKDELGQFSSNVVSMLDILPEDENEYVGVPSDNLLIDTTLVNPSVNIKQKYDINDSDFKLLRYFRDNVENDFNQFANNIGDYIRNTYKNALEQTKITIEDSSESERLRIAKKLITGDQKLASLSQYKVLMFHETVMYGLSIIIGLHKVLEDYQRAAEFIINITPAGAAFTVDEKNSIMDLLLNTIYKLTSDKQELVKVTYGNRNNFVQFEFGKIKTLVESLISQVRRYLDLFRPYLPEALISKYEGDLSDSSLNLTDPVAVIPDDKKYKLGFLEHSFYRFFVSRGDLSEYDQVTSNQIYDRTVYGINKRLNSKLTAPNNILDDRTVRGANNTFGEFLSKYIFYNNYDDNRTTLRATNTAGIEYKNDLSRKFGILFSKQIGMTNNGLNLPGLVDGNINTGITIPIHTNDHVFRFRFLDNQDAYYSLLVRFNDAIESLIEKTFDKPKNKVYGNLFTYFTNGDISSAVSAANTTNNNVFPNLARDIGGGNQSVVNTIGDLNNNAILYLTNALILRNLLYTLTNQGEQYFVTNNISEISSYMRDSYKVNLPLFIKEFNEILNLAKFLDDFIDSNRNIMEFSRRANATANGRFNLTYTGPAAGANELGANPFDAYHTAENDVINKYKAILKNISNYSEGIKSSLERVLREVAEDQKYLEYEEDLYNKFKSKHNRLPVALPSFTLLPLNTDKLLNFDDNIFGTNEYRYNYGIVNLLLDLDKRPKVSMPYNKELVDEFNKNVPSKDHFNIDEFNEFVHKNIEVTQYLINYRLFRHNNISEYFANNSLMPLPPAPGGVRANLYNAAINGYRALFGAPAAAGNYDFKYMFDLTLGAESINNVAANSNPQQGNIYNPNPLILYQLRSVNSPTDGLQDALQIFVSNDINARTTDVSTYISTGLQAGQNQGLNRFNNMMNANANRDRDQQRFYNFIDLNMIPFNPNAFMREIPLTHIYNYNYTFNKLIDHILKNNSNSSNLANFAIKRVLDNPYRMDEVQPAGGAATPLYNRLETYSVLVGDHTNEFLGRPKFLSDQIYNKILFGSMYSSNAAGITTRLNNANNYSNNPLAPLNARNYYNTTKTIIRNNEVFYPRLDGRSLSIRKVDVRPAFTNANVINDESEGRFNTVIVRNLIFITTLYRVLRAKLNQDLVKKYELITPTSNLVNFDMTEYKETDTQEDKSYFSEIAKQLRD